MDLRHRLEDARRGLRLARAHMALSPTGRRVRKERLTYLSAIKLRTLELCMQRINAEGVEGDVLEAGVALGGSAVLLATLMGPTRTFHGYDVFATIPAPTERDPLESHERYEVIAAGRSKGMDGDLYYGYRKDLYEAVSQTFRAYGIGRYELHRGLFEATLHPQGPVAFAHVDSDWYDPVKLALERVYPHLVHGGIVVLDDYFDFGGARQAGDEFLAAHPDVGMVLRSESVVLRREGRALSRPG